MKASKKRYTVIGLWEDNGQVCAYHVKAIDVYSAMQQAVNELEDSNPDELVIIGAFEGHATFFTPGDDNNKSCFASDLKTNAMEND